LFKNRISSKKSSKVFDIEMHKCKNCGKPAKAIGMFFQGKHYDYLCENCRNKLFNLESGTRVTVSTFDNE